MDASLFPEKVNAVVTTVAPFDFHANEGDTENGRGLIHFWARALQAADVDRAVDVSGNLSGELISQYFGLMTPVSTMTKYGVDLAEIAGDEEQLRNFLAMERWLSDRPGPHRGLAEAMDQGFLYREQTCQGRANAGRSEDRPHEGDVPGAQRLR